MVMAKLYLSTNGEIHSKGLQKVKSLQKLFAIKSQVTNIIKLYTFFEGYYHDSQTLVYYESGLCALF